MISLLGILLGALTAYIAYNKGRTAYAYVMAGWTAVAVLIRIFRLPVWINGPGLLFFIIALCLPGKDAPRQKPKADYVIDEEPEAPVFDSMPPLHEEPAGSAGTARCAYCGSELKPEANFCPECGAPVKR